MPVGIWLAEWLQRLNAKEAIPELKAALIKEKTDKGKAVLMNALERLGAPLEEIIDRSELTKEAEKGMKKGIPTALEWFPFNELPSIHWQSGEAAWVPTGSGDHTPHRR